MIEPTTIEELQEAVKEHPRVLAVGNGTKTRLSAVDDEFVRISTRKLSGITEYQPSEYTFTALAGTRVSEIDSVLAAKGQFLPCSTLLKKAGATIGGAIASGLSGPGRFRFGGLRDFLLGIHYVSGEGKLISAGGKVVKNAAGFDLPKFTVGSLGRFGALAEVTFKVFPKPSSSLSLAVGCDSHERAVERIVQAASSRWELYAIDYDPSDRRLHFRLGGPTDPVRLIADEISGKWPAQETDGSYWETIREPVHSTVAKVPITPKMIPRLQAELEKIGATANYSVAGNVAYIAADNISETLAALDLHGMNFLGERSAPLWLGKKPNTEIARALKSALDPTNRFPSL